MDPEAGKTSRKPRADSLRNRETLLEAARVVFGAGGQDASLEAVARKAGVGIGTLYRHFPTREALFQAVYKREVDQMVDLATRLPQEAAPVQALRLWLHAAIQLVATKRGMLAALSPAAGSATELYESSGLRLRQAAGGLIVQAVAAGLIRDDIGAEDLMRALIGMCYMRDQPGWQDTVVRLIDVFVDGMCLAEAAPKP
jgi:AcrR family transcriptional regulator